MSDRHMRHYLDSLPRVPLTAFINKYTVTAFTLFLALMAISWISAEDKKLARRISDLESNMEREIWLMDGSIENLYDHVDELYERGGGR